MPREQDQPIQALTMTPRISSQCLACGRPSAVTLSDQYLMIAARNAALVISVLTLSLHPGGEFVELVVILVSVARCVALKIGHADVRNHINALELR
jgi:hypothetical protein